MGEVTLQVPAEHTRLFRQSVYILLGLEADSIEVGARALVFPNAEWYEGEAPDEDPDGAEKRAEEIHGSARELGCFVELMDQLGWTGPCDRNIDLAGRPDALVRVVEAALADSGDAIDVITETRPFNRAAFDRATETMTWCADRRDELVEEVAA